MYISEKQLLVLNFRGLSFEFRIDPKLEVSNKINALAFVLCYDSPMVLCHRLFHIHVVKSGCGENGYSFTWQIILSKVTLLFVCFIFTSILNIFIEHHKQQGIRCLSVMYQDQCL